MSPAPRLVTQVSVTPAGVRAPWSASLASADAITEEVVEAITGGGQYVVRGVTVRTRGDIALSVGDSVTVQWHAGTPFMILEYRFRHGPGTDEPFGGGAFAEELFLTQDGGYSVWFRNADQLVQVVADAQTGDAAPQVVYWGRGHASYFAVDTTGAAGTRHIDVYKLNRPTSDEPFPKGFTVAAALVRTYVLEDEDLMLGTWAATVSGGASPLSLSGDIRYHVSVFDAGTGFSFTCGTSFGAVAPNGDLIVTVVVRSETVGPIESQGAIAFHGSAIVNVTRASILLSAFTGHTYRSYVIGLDTQVEDCVPGDIVIVLGQTVAVTVSPDAGAGARFVTNVLSVAAAAEDDGPPSVYSYAALAPAWAHAIGVNVTYDCFGDPISFYIPPPESDQRSDLTWTVHRVGALPPVMQVVGTFAGGSNPENTIPMSQGSRTRLLWANMKENGTLSADQTVYMTDLKVLPPTTTVVAGASSFTDMFGVGFPSFSPAHHETFRPVFVGAGDLVYGPKDFSAPYNRQFFYAARPPYSTISPKKDPALKGSGNLSRVTTDAHIAVIFTSIWDTVQTLNSPSGLLPLGRHRSGPL